jgi:hypothetical protein
MTRLLWIVGILFVTFLLALMLQVLETYQTRIYCNEGFEQYTRDPNTFHQTGYVNGELRPSSGTVPSQLENVPSIKDVLTGKLQRFSGEIPTGIVTGSLNVNNPSHMDTIIQTFVKDANSMNVPDIILNPNSVSGKQVTCRLGETCDEDVILGNVYCPVGMRKVETGDPNQPYSGCYSGGRNVLALSCRHNESSGMGLSCRPLRDKKVQRVGDGFQMFPSVEVYQRLVAKYQAENNEEALRQISNSWHRKWWLVIQMALSYKDFARSTEQHSRQILWQYIQMVFMYGLILYQPTVEDMTHPRIGVILPPTHPVLPNLQTEQYMFDYNITNISNIHDTTLEPLPILRDSQ